MRFLITLIIAGATLTSCTEPCPEEVNSMEVQSYSMNIIEDTYILNMDENLMPKNTNSMARKMLNLALVGELDAWDDEGEQLDSAGVRALLTRTDTIVIMDPSTEDEMDTQVVINQVNEEYLGLVLVNDISFDETSKNYKGEITRMGVGTPYTMKGAPVGNDVLFWLSAPE